MLLEELKIWFATIMRRVKVLCGRRVEGWRLNIWNKVACQ